MGSEHTTSVLAIGSTPWLSIAARFYVDSVMFLGTDLGELPR